MKVFTLKTWLCGIVMMCALVFIASQTSFAMDDNTTDEQNIASSNQGEVGIARYRIPSKIKKGLRELDKSANAVASGEIQLYAAFTSDTEADEEVGDVTIVPVLDDAGSYLYVAFRVTASMKVDIRWKLDDATVNTVTGFEDPVDGGNLSPNYWYFAWYKPTSITPNGLHDLKVEIKKNGQNWSASKEDSCKFTVLSYIVP